MNTCVPPIGGSRNDSVTAVKQKKYEDGYLRFPFSWPVIASFLLIQT